MVSPSHNLPEREVLESMMIDMIRQDDILPQLATNIKLPGIGTYQVQGNVVGKASDPEVAMEFVWKPANIDIQPFAVRVPIIQRDIELKRRAYEGNHNGIVEQNVKQTTMDFVEARNQIILAGSKDEGIFGFLDDPAVNAGEYGVKGGGTNRPCTCNATPGTAETGAGGWFGAQKVVMAPVLDIANLIRRLTISGFHGPYTCVMHPIMEGFLAAPALTKSAEYNAGSTYLGIIKGMYPDLTIIATKWVDYDYIGAEDGTTQVMMLADAKNNFSIGVGQELKVDEWRESYHGTHMATKVSEAICLMPHPYEDPSNDGRYLKAVAIMDCEGYDNAAD